MSNLEVITEETRNNLKLLKKFPEVEISNSLKQEISRLLKEQNSIDATFYNRSFSVETSPNHFAIIPNQYFYLAVKVFPLAKCLRKLFDYVDNTIRKNDEYKKTINTIQERLSKNLPVNIEDEIEKIDFSSLSNEDRNDFLFLISNLNDSKKFGNIEKNTFRTSEDLLGSYILNIVPLTTAASGYLGTLVYSLTSSFSLYERLCNEIEICSSSNIHIANLNCTTFPIQKIFYGVPGSGKSHRIDSEIEEKIPAEADRDFQAVRVVFHPDYTNADFVGQILPVTSASGIKYEFKPGAFSKILWRAYHNPEKNFYLIVEEINRGNAAAIFGDIFQLLDRRNDGWSKYFVENDFVNNYLRSQVEFSDSSFNENHGNPAFQINGSAFTANSGIRLPPNLSILATMNTSDQNVFTLDNAFQRRWSMELVPNVLEKDSDQYNLQIGETGICWGIFRKVANDSISKNEDRAAFSSMEDSRLGSYFIQAEENNSVSVKSFAEKVLKYLWDDVFKMNHEQFFRITDSFESVVNEFQESKNFDSILNEEIAAELKNESTGQ